MDNNVRLLVHAGASSTRQDDDRRIVQVAAYLELESLPASRKHVRWPLDGDGSSGMLQDRNVGSEDVLPDDAPSGGADSTTFIDDTQLAYTTLESQIFTSPARTARHKPVERQSRITSTAPAPSKVVRLSGSPKIRPQSPDREFHPERSSTESEGPVISTERVIPAEQLPSQPKPLEKTQPTEGAITSNETTSELPNSYSLGDFSDVIHSRPQLSERSTSDPGPSPAKQGVSVVNVPEVSSHSTLSRDRRPPLETAPDGTVPQRSKAHNAAITSHFAEVVTSEDLLPKVASFPPALSLSIESAEPVTSIEPFTTHITPTLHKLAENPELFTTFQPTLVERTLSAHERGHWEVHCPNWNTELQTSFWRTLESVVGTGRAGWGVWCIRGPQVPLCSQSSQQHGQRTEQDSDTSFGPVRVYCWGEIAKHVYLLLYVASNSKVRKLGLRWIDAQGLVVLQMRTE